MRQFLIGSKAFFSGFDDFRPVDTDILVIDDNPDFVQTKSFMDGDTHYVYWEEMSKERMMEEHKWIYKGRYIQKFLVPEFAEYLGLTIEDLKSLSFLLDRLDEQHGYCRVIYYAYIKNNSFTLTEKQLNDAYDVYKKERFRYYQ